MNSIFHKSLTWIIAAVWFVNGLYCKILGNVPRHEQIVARILGNDYAKLFTFLIGISEILLSIWIVSRIRHRVCSIFQILIVLIMNILEFFIASDLLLWHNWNLIFAMMFVSVVWFQEFKMQKNTNH